MTKGRKSVPNADQAVKQGKKGSNSKNKGALANANTAPPAEVKQEGQLNLPEVLPEVPSEKVSELEPKKSNSVDDMSGDELKAYAAKVGVSQRDIDGLTEDRLRQNCKARIFSAMEDD